MGKPVRYTFDTSMLEFSHSWALGTGIWPEPLKVEGYYGKKSNTICTFGTRCSPPRTLIVARTQLLHVNPEVPQRTNLPFWDVCSFGLGPERAPYRHISPPVTKKFVDSFVIRRVLNTKHPLPTKFPSSPGQQTSVVKPLPVSVNQPHCRAILSWTHLARRNAAPHVVRGGDFYVYG